MPVRLSVPPLLVAAVFSVLIAIFALAGRALAEPPNVILITLDDGGLQLSSYGDDTQQTPNLDRIAREGVRFTNGYITTRHAARREAACSPACTRTRTVRSDWQTTDSR